MPHDLDYVHSCNSGNKTLDQEDVLVIGNWVDYTGSADVARSFIQTAGTQNTLAGTRGDIEGEFELQTTKRGRKAPLYRQRQHLNFVNLKK
jgi:hypothetical protein